MTTRIYGVHTPQNEGFSYIQTAFANAGLTFDDRNQGRYRQLLQEQRHIPQPLSSYGYDRPYRDRHIFLIVDAHGLIVGGAECVPVFWYGTGVGESHILVRNLVVLPRYRRKQVATTLLRGIMMKVQAEEVRIDSHSAPFLKMRTIITAGNRNAICLFYRCGWEMTNENVFELYEYPLAQSVP